MPIRTRFAPSPTGFLHIGGVRTALFNWLLTRRHGGQFILRIDDTDAERNRPEALQPILDGFRWLGIDWDEGPDVGGGYGPYFQSQRSEIYAKAARQLLESGQAYPCLATREELAADRKAAEAAKRPFIHRGKHRDISREEAVKLSEENQSALRLKIPLGRKIVIEDLIRGRVEWESDLIGDPVILRPDGRALYNFATVVDDAAMEISHVIRAAEHLSNTPTQVIAYEVLGLPVPQFAHVPVVNEPGSKKKLSKRDMKKFVTPDVRKKLNRVGWSDEDIDAKDDLNPATAAYYRELGYLPAALVNYLGRLGWSLDDKSEIIPLDRMRENFSLDRVNDSPASFDPDKLYWLAGEYMRMISLEERAKGALPYLQRAGLVDQEVSAEVMQKTVQVVDACGDRLKLFSDILPYGAYFFADPEYDEKAVKKRLKKEGVAAQLRAFANELGELDPFTTQSIEERLRSFCEEHTIKPGDMIHALRVSTTGVPVGPGVFDCLIVLGREEVLRRIELGLSHEIE